MSTQKQNKKLNLMLVILAASMAACEPAELQQAGVQSGYNMQSNVVNYCIDNTIAKNCSDVRMDTHGQAWMHCDLADASLDGVAIASNLTVLSQQEIGFMGTQDSPTQRLNVLYSYANPTFTPFPEMPDDGTRTPSFWIMTPDTSLVSMYSGACQ